MAGSGRRFRRTAGARRGAARPPRDAGLRRVAVFVTVSTKLTPVTLSTPEPEGNRVAFSQTSITSGTIIGRRLVVFET